MTNAPCPIHGSNGCYGFVGARCGATAPPPNAPIPMRLPCPSCGALHIDEGDFAFKVHHTHACQECGNVWRPAVVATVGVRFLPGFKNEEASDA